MLKNRFMILVFLILVSSVFAQSSLKGDFNNDGKVDLEDFFLFADNFQKEVNKDNEMFDLDKNNKIDVEDFFIFAEEFGKKVTKIGIFYVSESDRTYNPNWSEEFLVFKNNIEDELNSIFEGKRKFEINILGDYKSKKICWNPSRVAFELENPNFPNNIRRRLHDFIRTPGSWIDVYGNNVYFEKDGKILWENCPEDICKEYIMEGYPSLRFFRHNCRDKKSPLILVDFAIELLLDEMDSNWIKLLEDHDINVVIIGKAGPIIPQIGEREKHYFCKTSGDSAVGFYAGPIGSTRYVVIAEHALKIPSYYVCDFQYSGSGISSTIFNMPGWQPIIHEILHSFGAVDVYEDFSGFGRVGREQALKLEPESEVDKSIMADGWAGYCRKYRDNHTCTSQDIERIYLDKYNKQKILLRIS